MVAGLYGLSQTSVDRLRVNCLRPGHDALAVIAAECIVVLLVTIGCALPSTVVASRHNTSALVVCSVILLHAHYLMSDIDC